jgi:hypothetical protein
MNLHSFAFSLRVLRVLCGKTNTETAKSAKKAQRVAKANRISTTRSYFEVNRKTLTSVY